MTLPAWQTMLARQASTVMLGPWTILDCIIVGGGAAGLSAALVLGRARRRTLVVDAGEQSNGAAEGIGGLLGHDRRPPEALYRTGRDELAAYPSVEVRAGLVVGAVDRGNLFGHRWQRALLLRLWSGDVTLFTNGAADPGAGDVGRLHRAGIVVDERVVDELRGPGRALEAVAFTDGTARHWRGTARTGDLAPALHACLPTHGPLR